MRRPDVLGLLAGAVLPWPPPALASQALLASLAADGVVSLAEPLTKYAPEFIAPLSEGGPPIRLI
jgi:hypothetical protein